MLLCRNISKLQYTYIRSADWRPPSMLLQHFFPIHCYNACLFLRQLTYRFITILYNISFPRPCQSACFLFLASVHTVSRQSDLSCIRQQFESLFARNTVGFTSGFTQTNVFKRTNSAMFCSYYLIKYVQFEQTLVEITPPTTLRRPLFRRVQRT